MEVTKNFKRRRRFWFKRCCGPPTNAQKLFMKINSGVTTTLVDGNVVNPGGVNNPEIHICGKLRGA
jgi:hypothetical protein